MKNIGVALSAAMILAAASVTSSQAGSSGPSVFTSAQAAAGAKDYSAKCSRCHGANLEGVSAPALRGSGSGIKGDTVGEAFTFISTQMPAGDPGSLTTTEYTSIVAYLLSRNGHAPGTASLTPALAKSTHVKF